MLRVGTASRGFIIPANYTLNSKQMQRISDKESDKDGDLTSATLSSGFPKPCQQSSDDAPDCWLVCLSQVRQRNSVLPHITNGSERPTEGVHTARYGVVS